MWKFLLTTLSGGFIFFSAPGQQILEKTVYRHGMTRSYFFYERTLLFLDKNDQPEKIIRFANGQYGQERSKDTLFAHTGFYQYECKNNITEEYQCLDNSERVLTKRETRLKDTLKVITFFANGSVESDTIKLFENGRVVKLLFTEYDNGWDTATISYKYRNDTLSEIHTCHRRRGITWLEEKSIYSWQQDKAYKTSIEKKITLEQGIWKDLYEARETYSRKNNRLLEKSWRATEDSSFSEKTNYLYKEDGFLKEIVNIDNYDTDKKIPLNIIPSTKTTFRILKRFNYADAYQEAVELYEEEKASRKSK